ncbi:GMC family oxidoreductase [Allobranchiibius huperziae]|uniref:Choline dehydrogenase n=1 Tax=Allobranchiibius huperziae TaxID=1874116 RepID=A0A853DHJ9_9MICO|nr:GMC family oxidoreductase N-terminal domain-containing protein [Allobranchiibius huperziae]NYJ75419.1 choline dehydrogenase [Allobranchiibius huperziae]
MHDTYDYVVIGGGSAGCVLAARLTEDPGTTVLLIEAGGEADADEISIPAGFPSLFRTRWDWNYHTTGQKQLDARPTYWPRMKALGGCSSMNAMIYIRGNRVDYDTWRDAHGATGWGYDDVLPYFKRAEHNSRLGDPFHGQDGPLYVEDRRYDHELNDAWIASAVASGMGANDDFNGARQEGAGFYQVTCKGGRRWSTERAYLEPARGRTNLEVITGAMVERIELDGDRAVGVTFEHLGERRTARVDAEVLLCAGAINSPQLLMLSGIGPGGHLRETGVDVRHDLPGVGANLHDHPFVPLIWETKGTTDLLEFNTLPNILKAKALGRGPLTSNVAQAGAFFHSREGLAAPDLQVHFTPTGFWDNAAHESGSRKVSIGTTLVSVASRGQLRLRSADPSWHPSIDPAYYDDQRDLDAMLAGCERLLDVANSGPLATYLDTPFMPDTASPSTEQLEAHIRRETQTLYHPVGTCAMGEHPDAVVDAELRVHGLTGLRVVDASVMPEVPRGNTNAPTIMIAERAADLLRGRASNPSHRLADAGVNR